MSNEEIAVSIQQGNNELIPELWEQVQKFLYALCNRYITLYDGLCQSTGVTLEDLKQECYFVMLEAVKAYKADSSYKFLTFCKFPFLNRFKSLVNLRGKQQDCLSKAVSLDMPIGGEDEDITLLDTIADSGNDMLKAEEKIYLAKLHGDLQKSLDNIPVEEADIIRQRYFEGKERKEVAQSINMNVGAVRTREGNALRHLRSGENGKRLLPYRADIISRYGYKSSFSLWRDSGFSSTEFAAFKLLGVEM